MGKGEKALYLQLVSASRAVVLEKGVVWRACGCGARWKTYKFLKDMKCCKK